MKRLLVLTVALVVAWLGLLPQTAGAVPLAPQAVASHSYDGYREDAGSICTTTERGPPARCEHNTAYDAGDRWSCGASASPNPPRTRLAYGYDVLGRFAQSARSSRGAEEQVEQVGSAEPGPVVVRRSRVAANTAVRPAQVAFGPVPENAWATFGRVQSKGSPLPGYKGGSTFGNTGQAGGQVLPRSTSGGSPITYREWDVNPYVKGVDRGAERIVTGSDGSAYYTSDHYRSFIQFWSGG
ncbi:ribonuclease domain-containing protein [Cellulomonas palmilytica]|uniref:ribonuclease domain-containing protein n=1 Tax=Cellulomonas palmilytica TaxID=2608402 RepID=UPI001F4429AF|nr:ribonuclease domain-containing protein [Cellulomonas palmilytica]UJP39781.1 hypothetical protein F1D97_16060 [Cellulomonas palmilytica]